MQWRRKNYLIDKDFQFRYIGRIVFSIIVMALITAFTVYYTTWARIMDQFYNVPQIASQFSTLFSSVNSKLLVFLVVFLVLIAVVSVFISHSIAGPVYRFEKSLQAIASGDFTLRIGLRKGDEFKHLAGTINNVIATMRTNLASDKEVLQQTIELFNQIQEKHAKKGKAPVVLEKDLEELNQLLNKLQQDFQRFKLE